MAPQYLIIGASGFIGTQLYATLGSAKAIPTYNRTRIPDGVEFDASRMRLADTVLKRQRGLTHAFVLHGETSIDRCAADPSGTAEVNVAGTKRVIDDLLDHGVTPVFASSDAVFDGSRGRWVEEDPVRPILTYGRQKAEVESYLLGKSNSGLVLRLGKVVAAAAGSRDMLGDWVGKLESGTEIRCAHDQMLSPLAVEDAVTAFLGLAESRRSGIFHVCGPLAVSRLKFLQTLAAEIGRHRKLQPCIMPCSLRDFSFAEPRPLNNSMSPQKVQEVLGRKLDDYRAICRKAAISRYTTQLVSRDAGHARVR